jgi:maltokinase
VTEDSRELVDRLVGELPSWLPARRWFAGKDRPITSVRNLVTTELVSGDPLLLHVVIEVEQGDRAERYQLLVGGRTHLPEHFGSNMIGTVDGIACYDATSDPDLTAHLLDKISDGERIGPLVFEHEPDVELETGLRPRPITAEQSNTSLAYGNRYILKLFRKLAGGLNPDLRLHRALWAVGCQHIAQPLGSISADLRDLGATGDLGFRTGGFGDFGAEPTTIAMLQHYLPDAVEGWAMATTSVRDLMADVDGGADQAGGDFASEAHRLGQAVAVVHSDLQRTLGQQEVDEDELDRTVRAMRTRLDRVTDMVPELAAYGSALRTAYDQVRDTKPPVYMQFIHGDLHLGQVLRTVAGWLLIDFEGEPAAPPAERAMLRSPLRDVAGMLRSFDYAAHQLLIGQPADARLTERAFEWAERNRTAFCEGYGEAAGDSLGDPRNHVELLRAFELDKAVYEVAYEHANRPDWSAVPLSSIARIIAGGE